MADITNHDPTQLDGYLKGLFVRELVRQGDFALMAYNGMISHLNQLSGTNSGSTYPVFFFVHAFVTHAAMVSKILWPSPAHLKAQKKQVGDDAEILVKMRETRGETLRKELKIEDSPAIRTRTIRDHLEHYDERLEVWALKSHARNIADMNIMSPGAIIGLDPREFHRNLNPETLEFSFRGDSFDLPSMAQELTTIRQAADHWLVENDPHERRYRDVLERMQSEDSRGNEGNPVI